MARTGLFSTIVLFSLFVMLAPQASHAAFAPPVSYDVGGNPRSVFAADLDGDGDRDLAVANYSSHSVSILLNNGDGTLAAAVNYSVGSNPANVFAADLDGDGDLDLAVGNFVSDNVSILLNDGNGTFAAAVNYASGDGAWSVFAADLDGDGDRDLAVTNSNVSTVSILLNNGDGTFAAGVTYPVQNVPASIHAIDLDGDGDRDLAVANYFGATVSILLNNGDGTFAAAVHYEVGNWGASQWNYPIALVAIDLDGDNDADIATANYDNNQVSVLTNNGDGTFTASVEYPVGSRPPSIFAADLDNDGDPDLATANYFGATVSALLNNGNGTFAARTDYSAGAGAWSVTAADLDGDNDVDLAVANYGNAKVSVLSSDLKDTAAFQLTDPGDTKARTRLAYAVSRVDQDGDPVITGSDTVYLSTDSSDSGPHFYDAESGGSEIASRTIGPGASSVTFWYTDDAVGDWTVTASDNAVAPDGAVGIDDGTDTVTVVRRPSATDPTLEIPNEIEVYFEEGECSPDAVATFHFHAHSTGWYRIGQTPDLEGLPWLNFDGTAVHTDITFPEADGEYVLYFQLRSPSFQVTPVMEVPLRVDLTDGCVAPPHEQELRDDDIVAPELDEACIADFAHATVVPYLVFPDGRVLKPGSAAVQVKSPSATGTSYAFDVEGNGERDHLVLHLEHFEGKVSVYVRSSSSTTVYELRAEVLVEDLVVKDELLWEAAPAAGDERVLDLDAYPEICSAEEVYYPHPGDLVRVQFGPISYIATDFKRHPFPDDVTFASWYGTDALVRTWPFYVLAHFPIGRNVTLRPGSGVVQVRSVATFYLIAPNRTLQRVLTESVLDTLLGPAWSKTALWIVDGVYFGDYTIGKNVAEPAHVQPVPAGTTIDTELGLPSLEELLEEEPAGDGADVFEE